MKRLHKLRKNMAFNVVSAVVLLLIVFSWVVSTIGYISFTNALKKEYSQTTYRMADTATALVEAEHLDDYLASEGKTAEYAQTKAYLDTYCERMDVSLVYVIKVDTEDYGSFVSIFNSVGKDTPYTPWEIGYTRKTANKEYASVYKSVYEGGLKYGTIYQTKQLNGAPPHITTLVPVKTAQGEVKGILCIQRPMEQLNRARRPYLLHVAISTLILSVLVSYFASDYIRKQIVIPLRRLSAETERFAKHNRKGKTLGSVSRIEEIARLASSIETMEEDMGRYITNLTAITAEKEKMGTELTIASTIQNNSVPNEFPAFPLRKEFDIYACMNTAKEVGGDFYNFFLVDEDHLAMVIADVSGKGVPAALFMMVTNILISDRTRMGGTPAEILQFVNESVCEHNQAQMFVTVWLGILEISTGKIIACNAGHEDPALYRKGGKFEMVRSHHDLVVGAMNGVQYKNFEMRLEKGDKLFLYTDGVPEATNKEEKMLTALGMLNALDANKTKTPQGILEGVKACVDRFVGDAPQFDDLTMMCLELK